jgi:hypothetical protein
MQTSSDVVPLSEIELFEYEFTESSQEFTSTYSETIAELQISSYPLSEIVLNDVGFTVDDIIPQSTYTTRAATNAANSYTLSLNVPYVANATMNGAGICWAACVGAILSYRVGGSYTATGVYNALASLYPTATPVGQEPWYSRGYQLGGLTATVISSGVSLSTVYTQLNAGKPLIFSISGSTIINNQIIYFAHDIVCKYLYSDLSVGTMYGFMDPNYSNTKYISVSYPEASINNSDFIYVDSLYTYTAWHRTAY